MTLRGKVATVARNYISSQDVPPVLLIAGDFRSFTTAEPWGIDGQFVSVYDLYLDRTPPFRLPPQVESQHGNSADQLSHADGHCKTYVRCLNHLIYHMNVANNDVDLSLLSMLPLLHMKALLLYRKSQLVRDEYINPKFSSPRGILHGNSYFTTTRVNLRRCIEDFETERIRFIDYIHGYQQDVWSTHSVFRRVDCLWEDCVRDARLIETEIRDNMQLLASQSALEASKKSIEISNYQIQEGKRGKWSWFQM